MAASQVGYGSVGRSAALALAIVAVTAGVSLAVSEPTGFGKARFQMTVEQVRAIFPKMEKTDKDLGAASVGGPLVARYLLSKVPVEGLAKPTDVELRFWREKLWVVVVYLGENDVAEVATMLDKQLGAGKGDASNRSWIGEKTTAALARRERYYSFSDNELSEDARASLFPGLYRPDSRTAATPSAASSTAPTPAAAGGAGTPGAAPGH